MDYLLAILALLAFGLALPASAIGCVVWLFGDKWGWRHFAVSAPIVLACINAPAYSAAVTGLITWKSALAAHVIAIALFGIATAINGGNPTEGYALAIVILTLSVSIDVVRRAWREDETQGSMTEERQTDAAENHGMHTKHSVGRFDLRKVNCSCSVMPTVRRCTRQDDIPSRCFPR